MPNDPFNTFARTQAVWSFPSGVDISLKTPSRNLTVTGIGGGQQLAGIECGNFSIDDRALFTNPNFLALPNLSIEFIIQPATMTGTGWVVRVGSASSTFGPSVGCFISGPNARGGYNWGMVKRGTLPGGVANAVVQGSTGLDAIEDLIFDSLYHVVIVATNGVNNRIFINGHEIVLTHVNRLASNNAATTSGALGGDILVPATSELAIGNPSTTQTGFIGLLGRVVAHPYPMTEVQAAANFFAIVDENRLFNVGSAVPIGQANHGPVAVPFYTDAVVANGINFIDIPVAARGFDADNNPLTALLAPDNPNFPNDGTRSISPAGLLRYVPNGTAVARAPDTVEQRVRDLTAATGIFSDGIVRVPIIPFIPPTNDDLPPTTPAANDVFVTTNLAANLQAAYTALPAAGNATIWVTPGVVDRASGDWAFNRDFTNPVVIRPVGNAWGGLDFRERMVVSGNNNVIAGVLYNDLNFAPCISVTGRNSRITRCNIDHDPTTDGNVQGISIGAESGIRVDHNSVQIFRGSGGGAAVVNMCIRVDPNSLPDAPRIDHNWVHDCNGLTDDEALNGNTNGYEAIQIGGGNPTALDNIGAVVEFNLIENCTNESEAMSIKSSRNIIRFNITRNCGRGGMSQRVGNFGTWTGNRSESSRGFVTWGGDHTYIGNVITGGNDFSLDAGNSTVAEYNAPGGQTPANNRPAAERCVFYHNNGPLNMGDNSDATFNSPVRVITIRNHTGTTTVFNAGADEGTIDEAPTGSPVPNPGTATLLGGTAAGPGVNCGIFGFN